MSECEKLSACPFFNNRMKNMPSTADLIKKKYCQGNFIECARYIVLKHKGKDAVPDDLFPYDDHKARKIINDIDK